MNRPISVRETESIINNQDDGKEKSQHGCCEICLKTGPARLGERIKSYGEIQSRGTQMESVDYLMNLTTSRPSSFRV